MKENQQPDSRTDRAQPFYLLLKTKLLFELEWKDWQHYESEPDHLLTRIELYPGIAGIEGEIRLCIPPSKQDRDGWEGSHSAGEDEVWAFLSFMICPIPQADYFKDGVNLVVFFGRSTFFDRPMETVKLFAVKDEADDLVFSGGRMVESTALENAKCALVQILKRMLGATESDAPL